MANLQLPTTITQTYYIHYLVWMLYIYRWWWHSTSGRNAYTKPTIGLKSLSRGQCYLELFTCKLPNKLSRSPYGIPSAGGDSHSNWVSRSMTFSESRSTLAFALRFGSQPTLLLYTKGNASLTSNYRPISIIPAICRLFERIVTDCITYHMHAHNLTTDTQHGFVKGRSTDRSCCY